MQKLIGQSREGIHDVFAPSWWWLYLVVVFALPEHLHQAFHRLHRCIALTACYFSSNLIVYGNRFFVKSLKKEMPVNFPSEALPVVCVILVSLISAIARQTLCCVFYCPQHSSAYVSAPKPMHWGDGERETINLPCCTCQQRFLPLPVGCLSHHLCLELVLKLLPRWIRTTVLVTCPGTGHHFSVQTSPSAVTFSVSIVGERVTCPWEVYDNIKIKGDVRSYFLGGIITEWTRGIQSKYLIECLAVFS